MFSFDTLSVSVLCGACRACLPRESRQKNLQNFLSLSAAHVPVRPEGLHSLSAGSSPIARWVAAQGVSPYYGRDTPRSNLSGRGGSPLRRWATSCGLSACVGCSVRTLTPHGRQNGKGERSFSGALNPFVAMQASAALACRIPRKCRCF